MRSDIALEVSKERIDLTSVSMEGIDSRPQEK